jgi:hypothetical protein
VGITAAATVSCSNQKHFNKHFPNEFRKKGERNNKPLVRHVTHFHYFQQLHQPQTFSLKHASLQFQTKQTWKLDKENMI